MQREPHDARMLSDVTVIGMSKLFSLQITTRRAINRFAEITFA